MLILQRRATKAGAWLGRRAKKLAERLFSKELVQSGRDYGGSGMRREVVDGFLLEGKRVGRRGVATVLDFPALIVCPGEAYFGDEVMDGQIISLVRGRDELTDPDPNREPSLFEPPFQFASFFSGFNAGMPPSGAYRYRLAVFGGYPLIKAGCLATDVSVHLNGQAAGSPMAYAKPGDDLSALCTVYAPTFYSGRAVIEDGEFVRTYAPSAPTALQTAWTVRVNESLVRATGADGMTCKRASAPAYSSPPSSDDLGFANAQAPWARSRPLSVTADSDDGLVYDFVVAAHAVIDQRSDNDWYAARCLWVSRLRVQAGEVLQFFSYLRDRRGLGPTKQPNLNDAGDAYQFNLHPYAELVTLADGSTLVLDFFTTTRSATESGDPDEGLYQYRTVELLTFATDVNAPSITVLQDALRTDGLLNPDDMFFPVGGDTDGVNAVFIVFSSNMLSTDDMPIYVITVTELGAAVALAQDVPWRPVSGDTEANCVTYIGNGKFAFLVSSYLDWNGTTPGQQRGDWSCAVYDINTNTLALAGVIDPELTLYGASTQVLRGRIDCPRRDDEAGELSTLIASWGGSTFGGDYSGGTGSTMLSVDSGVTWQSIALYGSAHGAFYAGNAVQPRNYDGQLTIAEYSSSLQEAP